VNTSYIELAKKYIKKHYNEEIKEIERLETGLCHYVYDISFYERDNLVIRIASQESKNLIDSGIYWLKYLSNLELPIPDLYHYNLEIDQPYMIISKLQGRDLAYVYDSLTGSEKEKLAREIVDIQRTISLLQPNDFFGYANKYHDETLRENTSWKQVIYDSIMKSKKLINQNNIFDSKYSDLLLSKLGKFDLYFSKIKPKAFLDDLTTKNVLLHQGKFTGIVDIDQVCFGDKIFHLALTKMALLAQESDTDYIDFMIEEYKLDKEELEILNFYVTVSCLGFMSELGQKFNKDEIISCHPDKINLLENIFLKHHNSTNIMKTDMMRYGDSCNDFYQDNLITEIIRLVKQGKEASVICAKAHKDMPFAYLAIKLYREKKFRNFKRDRVYHIGRIWDKRLLRAIKNKSTMGQLAERSSWVTNEFNTLERLYYLGVNVPKPLAYTEDAVIMEFLGYEDESSLLLKDTHLSLEQAKKVYDKIMEFIKIMLRNNIVHGDLSHYNILYHKNEPYIIDFPQAVNPAINPYAYDLLLRDVENICRYFSKYNIQSNPYLITQKMWSMAR
jgi:RIO kinase 1